MHDEGRLIKGDKARRGLSQDHVMSWLYPSFRHVYERCFRGNNGNLGLDILSQRGKVKRASTAWNGACLGCFLLTSPRRQHNQSDPEANLIKDRRSPIIHDPCMYDAHGRLCP